jgi:glutaredoxin
MRILLAVALCTFALGAGAQVYRWTDDQGRVHITDTPPPASAKGVKRSDGGGTTPAPAEATKESSGQEPFSLRQARAKYPVTLYTVPNCEGCNQARRLLNARGIPFKENSLTDAAQMDEFKQAVGGNTVPAMIVGSTVQKGFEEGAYHALLDAAGYPATGILPARNQQQPTAAAPALPDVKPVAEPEKPTGPYAPGAAPPPPPTPKK